MSYPTVSFDRVFNAVLRATGQPQSVIALLSTDDQERLVSLINQALCEFWDEGFWPGTFAIEQRALDPVGFYVLKAAAGETQIGTIDPMECFYSDEPLPGSLKHVLGQVEDRGDRIVCFDFDCPAAPYVRFQLPCPQFTREAYDETVLYGAGARVYDATTGECYTSLQAANIGNDVTDADWWQRVAFPVLAENFVRWSASSEWLAEADGKYKQAARAMRELDRLAARYLPSQQVGR